MYLRERKGTKNRTNGRKCLQLKWGAGERVVNYGGAEGPNVRGHMVY